MSILATEDDFTITEDCDGTGIVVCDCAGDFCACAVQGAAICPGCPSCRRPEPEQSRAPFSIAAAR